MNMVVGPVKVGRMRAPAKGQASGLYLYPHAVKKSNTPSVVDLIWRAYFLVFFCFFGTFFFFSVVPWSPGPLVSWSPGPLVCCRAGLFQSR